MNLKPCAVAAGAAAYVVMSALALVAPAARADVIDEDSAAPTPKPGLGPSSAPESGAAPAARPDVKPSPRGGGKSKSLDDDTHDEGARRPAAGGVLAPRGGGKPKQAGKRDADQPIHFEGESFQALRDKSRAEIRKNVVVTQGSMRLEAERAEVFYDEGKKGVSRVVADGNVKMSKIDEDSGERIKAFGDQVVFDNKARTVVLEGNARLWRGADLVRGKKIIYEMDTGWVRADRVAGEVNPKADAPKADASEEPKAAAKQNPKGGSTVDPKATGAVPGGAGTP